MPLANRRQIASLDPQFTQRGAAGGWRVKHSCANNNELPPDRQSTPILQSEKHRLVQQAEPPQNSRRENVRTDAMSHHKEIAHLNRWISVHLITGLKTQKTTTKNPALKSCCVTYNVAYSSYSLLVPSNWFQRTCCGQWTQFIFYEYKCDM